MIITIQTADGPKRATVCGDPSRASFATKGSHRMSTVLIRREQLSVCITAREAGREFTNAKADVQADFLFAFSEEVNRWARTGGNWPQQCRAIVDEIDEPCVRDSIRLGLQTLIDHLDEPIETAG